MTSTMTEREWARLRALTEKREPSAQQVPQVIARVRDIQIHADERAAFYQDTPDLADEWSNLACEADYRAEKIESDTWTWEVTQ